MVRVQYRWLAYEDGGRRELPAGPSLRWPIRLASHRDQWKTTAWDVIFRFQCPAIRDEDQIGEIEFANEKAPHYLLVPGESFELCEGRNVVVRGRILGD